MIMTAQPSPNGKQIWLMILFLYMLLMFSFFLIFNDGIKINPKPLLSTKLRAPAMEEEALPAYEEVVDQNLLQAALNKARDIEYTVVWWPEPPFRTSSNPYRTDEEKCGKCYFTQEKEKVNHNNTKAVLFEFYQEKLSNIPKIRRPDQLYVWFAMESSPALLNLRGITLKQFDGFFNLTATHRRDSDVYWPYGTTADMWKKFRRSGSENPKQEIDWLIANKTNLALWIVSNCGVTKGALQRLELVRQLKAAGLKVDCKGDCFKVPVGNLNIAKKYKFYLSFENGYHCKDYITEKLFRNAFSMEAVPVVWGATKSDYEAVAPPGSFIYVEDFLTHAHLVKYLNYLDKNDEAYKKYFEWRTMNITDIPQYNRAVRDCNLCRILHGINVDNVYNPRYAEMKTYIPMFGYPNKSRIVPSLDKWYYGTERKACLEDVKNLEKTLQLLR